MIGDFRQLLQETLEQSGKYYKNLTQEKSWSWSLLWSGS
jgi:hypothetical protein